MNESTVVLLKQSAASLRALATQNEELETKLAAREKQDKAESIASQMRDRGLLADSDMSEKVSELKERDNLDVIEAALDLSAPDDLAKIASIGESPAAGGMSDLEAYVMSQAGN